VRGLPRPLDTSALTEQLPRDEVARRWKTFVTEQPKARDTIGRVRRVTSVVTTLSGLAGVPLMGLIAVLALGDGGDNAVRIAFGVGTLVVIMILIAVLLVRSTVRVWARRTSHRTHIQLLQFAEANGFDYIAGPVGAQRDMPWRNRGSLNLHRVLRSRHERGIEIADYEITGNSNNLAAQFGGFCALRLSAPLPHIMVRAQSRRRPGMSSAGAPRDMQRLRLEGDFDRHFELYCPEGYEADALYLFTPDVMARLIDYVSEFDIEVVDDWIILSTPRDLVTTSPQDWAAIAGAVDAIDDRVERWAAWRETRPPGSAAETAVRTVTAEGRRLKIRPSVDNILATCVLVLFAVGAVVALTG
jgi:hypothetical protein